MKATRIILTVAFVAVAALGFNAFAFHSGGVAECEGCHSMHSPTSPSFLLVASTPSATCLDCHEKPDTAPTGYHISTAGDMTTALPVERTPGGDFAWLKKTYTWAGEGGVTATEEGRTHGHNIIAPDSGYNVDPDFTYGPGGFFPASQLGCESCHDPHGKARRLSDGTYAATGAPIIASGSYNNSPTPAAGQAVGIYRLLWGAASPNKPANTNYTTYAVAVCPSTYNRTEATTQTRVAYGAGTLTNDWGAWCGSCHTDFNTTMKNLKHPIDVALGATIATNYNTYVGSGNMTGTSATAFWSLVPFAEATEDFAVLKTHALNNDSYLTGPANTDAVTCMSCHRAHASGFEDALRFYYSWEFSTYDGKYPGLDNTSMTSSRKPIQARGRNMADFQAAYYDRAPSKFATYQRTLCNKCHAQD